MSRRFALLQLLLVAGGCDDTRPKRPPDPTPVAVPAPSDGPGYYAQRCAQCHGNTGQGDGPAGKNLTPWPRSFANKEWQASVTDEHLRGVIVRGGQAMGKSAAMPANPDLSDKPQLVASLVDIVRSFGKR